MRKLIMWNLMTLDGYFEGRKSWEIDWHDTIWGPELEQLSLDQLKSVGTLLFGRVTYEGMASYWSTQKGEIADLMNSIPKIVFSSTLATADWKNTRLVREDAAEEVARLKRQPGKDLYLFGSADLASALTKAGLIDEYRIAIAPILLGGGHPLFKPGPDRLKLKLLEAKPLKLGGVLLRYEPLR
ncbi:MAG TPA: dihydrofolate reductase family protein [Thermoplasmata archaeon]|nr:dihydrofolate reductase family protein [Thermoplasmata archaeon]